MAQLFTNNAQTALAVAKAAGATTMTVVAGTGARFPALTGGDFFLATLYKIVDGAEASYEVVKVTARSIDMLTIVGAQEGTSPQSFSIGDQVSLRVTAGYLNSVVSTLAAHDTAIAGKAALNGDATKNFNVLSLNGGSLGGVRNKLINPTLRVNQRLVSSANVSGIYIADCWRTANGSAGGTLVSYGVNYNDTTSSNGFPSAYALTGSTTKPTLASTDYASIGTNIEGFDFAEAMFGTANAKSIVVSFRALASPVPSTITIAIRNKDGTRSYVAPVAIATGVNSYSVVIPGDTSGTWGKESGIGASLFFFFACGSSFLTATPNTWVSANAFGHSSMSNILDTAQKLVRIADVQLELGLTATPFSYAPQAEDVVRCQRYYSNSFPDGMSADTLAADATALLEGAARSESIDSLENNGRYVVKFPAVMRAAPTVTLRGYVGAATSWACQGTTAGGTPTAFQGGIGTISSKRFTIGSSISARQYNIQGHWEADAGL